MPLFCRPDSSAQAESLIDATSKFTIVAALVVVDRFLFDGPLQHHPQPPLRRVLSACCSNKRPRRLPGPERGYDAVFKQLSCFPFLRSCSILRSVDDGWRFHGFAGGLPLGSLYSQWSKHRLSFRQ